MSQDPLIQLQQRLGHEFADARLLQLALTHRSYSAQHNERLEFLGDSVLSLVISHLLYERLGELPEGDLSRVRANLVRQETLHQLGLGLGLPDRLRLGEGELRSGGSKRASILSNAVEALVGAVFLDGGFERAKAVVLRLYEDVDIRPSMPAAAKDPKTALQEWLQARRLPVPDYRIIATLGQAHRQTFEVACEVPALRQSQHGMGPSRRAAEQAAAQALLDILRSSS